MKNVLHITLALGAILLPPASASVLFENNVLLDFQASGPVSVAAGQNASVCATNPDNSPVSILVALLQADTGSLIATKQQILQSGGGTCLNSLGQTQGNLIGLVVANAHLTELGAIVQDRPGGGGGCITASVQIQTSPVNNTPGQTFLYVPLQHFQWNGQGY